MNRSELVDRVFNRHPDLLKTDVDAAVKAILETMAQTLTNGNRIEVRGFGSFVLNYRAPRNGRNPKSGEKVLVPAKYVPHFRAGVELRERVDYK